MIVKIHKGPDGNKVIAMCDSDILGKKLEQGNLQLDLTSSFYQGEEMSEDKLLEEIKKCPCHLNVAGVKSIEFLSEHGLVDKKKVLRIDGVPHEQIIIVMEG